MITKEEIDSLYMNMSGDDIVLIKFDKDGNVMEVDVTNIK